MSEQTNDAENNNWFSYSHALKMTTHEQHSSCILSTQKIQTDIEDKKQVFTV